MMKKASRKTSISSQEIEKRFWKEKKVLLISPHPDDEVFGCAGTLAKARDLGAEVYVTFFSVSDLKFYEKRGVVKGDERLKEIQKVAALLKWKDHDVIYIDSKKHMKLDAVPQFELIGQLENESRFALNRLQPDIVMIPAPSYNQDHRAVFDACFTALRIHAGGIKHSADTVLVYDSPTLTWNTKEREFHPNFYVDISDYVDLKLKAVQAYASQKRDSRDPCSLESVRDLAYTRGREVGRKACEAYMLYRQIV